MKSRVSVNIKNEYLSQSVALLVSELGFIPDLSGMPCDFLSIVDASSFFRDEYDLSRLIYLCENGGRIPKGVKYFLSVPFLNSELKSLILELGSEVSVKDGSRVKFKDGELVYNNERLKLTEKEARLFAFLYENCESPVSRDALHQAVWENKASREANVVDVYVSYIRKKTREVFGIDCIKAVRGVGYMYTDKYSVIK
ncbi:MAG: winged helix-turn-helix domain-containing protein [Clostridia bacterium]|nr:winged helix-turn-helix domain-containing protein [Clostridia bacterium]